MTRERETAARKKAEETAARQSVSESLEYNLALINAGGYVSSDDITIARFRYLLEVLAGKTKNSKQQIADMSVFSVEKLRKEYGLKVRLLDLMEGVNRDIPEGAKADYAEVLSVYVHLRYIVK